MTIARRLRPIAAGALVLALSLLALVATASAHTALVSASPAEGSTVTEQPGQVVLTFNEAVQGQFAQLAVADANGSSHQTGEPQASGATVTQAVGELPDGIYTVSFRVVSADGHPVTGSYQFSVAAAPAAPIPTTPDTTSSTSPAPTPAASSPGTSTSTTDSVPSESATPVAAGTESDGDDGGLGTGAIIALAAAAAALIATFGYIATGGRRRDTDGPDATDGSGAP
jgi:hypothetical protein